MTRYWKIRNFLAWAFNFHQCDCEFYTGQNILGKCHNCGGRVGSSLKVIKREGCTCSDLQVKCMWRYADHTWAHSFQCPCSGGSLVA